MVKVERVKVTEQCPPGRHSHVPSLISPVQQPYEARVIVPILQRETEAQRSNMS